MSAALRRTTASGWRFIRHLENDVTSILISLSHKACLSSPSIYLRSRLLAAVGTTGDRREIIVFWPDSTKKVGQKDWSHADIRVPRWAICCATYLRTLHFRLENIKPSNGSQYHNIIIDINNGLIKSTSCVASEGTGLLMSSPLLLSLTSVTFDGVFFWISLLSDIAALLLRLVQVDFKPIFYDFTVVAKGCLNIWPRNKPLLILVDAGPVIVCPNTWREMWRDAKGKTKTILRRDESCEGIALAGTFCSVVLRLLLSLKLVAWQQNLIAALLKWGLDIKSQLQNFFGLSEHLPLLLSVSRIVVFSNFS